MLLRFTHGGRRKRIACVLRLSFKTKGVIRMTALSFFGSVFSIISGAALVFECSYRLTVYIQNRKKKSEPSADTEGSRVSK